MTQQINLYARKVEQRRGPIVISFLLVLAVAGLLIAYWMSIRSETTRLQARVAQAKTQLEAQKGAVAAMKAELAKRTDPAKIAAEIGALRARAGVAQEIIGQLQRGELGTMDGFTGQLTSLARIGEPGVWLTELKIVNSGKGVEIQGRSLEAESVLRYAGQVNQRFAQYGASVNALELAPIAQGPAPTAATAVSFRLF
jgi:Tfp pilus assembly protein PilN